jgi:hypothetical protein
VKLVDNKLLQEEVVETKASTLESTENPQTMEEEEIKEEETMEYPKEDEEEMVEEEEKEMEEHDDEEKEEMEEHDDEEEKEMVEEEEEEMDEHEEEEMEKDKDKDYYEEGEEVEEEEPMTEAAQIESQEESSPAALNHSERAELEAFRRERKEGLIASFEDDLSSEFLSNLSNSIDNYSYDELEVTLSKEFTRVNRENKKSKPNAFIYKPEVKSSANKSESDLVKELIQKYK